MAQDAPADTAGPSSPPPRLPEGWLPQWEGVQRKWYYVQRTTGKSQWEIPTEPVVLTPSTTPTSIGTGPSQAPSSRPSTNSPQVWQGNTLAERIGSLADSARISSSLNAQLNRQSPNPTYGPSEAGWHANKTGQHLPYEYGQQFASAHGGYGPESQHQSSSENTGMGPTGAYLSHAQQVMGQQNFGQNYPMAHWGISGDATHGQPGPFNAEHIGDPYGGQAPGSMPFLQQSVQGVPASRMPNLHFEHDAPEPQWQVSQHPGLSNPGSHWGGSSGLSQPFFASQYAPQTIESSAGNMAPQSSHFSNLSTLNGEPGGGRPGLQSMHGSFPTHSVGSMDHGQSSMGYPLARNHSQQGGSFQQPGFSDPAATAHSAQGYQSQPSTAHGQYHSTSMARAQSGPGFASLGYPAVPDAHGNAHQYQNPLVQAGARQYLPQQQASHHDMAHQYHSGAPTGYQNQGSGAPASTSRISTSDSQFVSGPWASSTGTPSISGQGQPSKQG